MRTGCDGYLLCYPQPSHSLPLIMAKVQIKFSADLMLGDVTYCMAKDVVRLYAICDCTMN